MRDTQTILATHRLSYTKTIILRNKYLYQNTHTTPGSLTTRGHIPVILDLPKPQYKNANWERFKVLMEEASLPEMDGKPTQAIDKEFDKWFQHILEAKHACIPKTPHIISPHSNNLLKGLQTLY